MALIKFGEVVVVYGTCAGEWVTPVPVLRVKAGNCWEDGTKAVGSGRFDVKYVP